MVKNGCFTLDSPEKCCQYIDGRKDYDELFYKEPCVVVKNVKSPFHDRGYICQPLCFANNSCPLGDPFIGTISDLCENGKGYLMHM